MSQWIEHNCESAAAAIVIIGSGIIPVEKQGEGATKLYFLRGGERPDVCHYLLIIANATIIKYIISYKIKKSIVIVNE